MNKQNFFKKIYLSITTLSFYTTIIHERFIKTFIYLLLLTILISIPYSAYLGNYIYKQATEATHLLESDEFPNFYLKEGELVIESNTPFIFAEEEGKLLKIIIDNSNTYSFNDLAGYYLGYLITPKSIIQSQLGTTPRSINYEDMFFDGFNKKDLLTEIKMLQPFLSVLSSIFTMFFFIFTSFFKSLLSYFLVSFFKNIYGIPLSKSQSYKIAVYAITAGSILIEALRFTQIVPPTFFFGIFMFINSVYIGKVLYYFNQLKTDLSA